ncbi:MAG TPA: hypothetical protein VGI70_17035 [Polyangiales bacterium]
MSSCVACRDAHSVAELRTVQAQVERDFASAREAWNPAAVGARFDMGDGLRTGPGASATLALKRGGRMLIKSDTIVRFSRVRGEVTDIEIATGEVTVETGEVDLGVQTARGLVKLSRDSVVKVSAGIDRTRFDVAVGRAEQVGAATPLHANEGSGFELVLLPVSVQTAASEPKDAGEPREVKASAALHDLQFQPSPPSASLTLQPSESVTVHDPAPPTDVRMLVTRCAADAIWEFDGGDGRYDALRVHGTGELRARVPPGTFRHRVRCLRDGRPEAPLLASGRLQVLRDAAVRPLPSKPVSITADADGRRYTISYQNRLPVITLRWPDAPKHDGYTLHVWPARGAAFSVQAKQPSITLPAEQLGEGSHRFAFEAKGIHSEQGSLDVSFDYRARTAYLTSPLEGQSAITSKGVARFEGGTLLDSRVSVEGVALKLDSQGRFSGEVTLPADATSAAVRVVHPSTGIHYYIRHLLSVAPP